MGSALDTQVDLFLDEVFFFGSSFLSTIFFGGLSFGALLFFCIVQLESLGSLPSSFFFRFMTTPRNVGGCPYDVGRYPKVL